MKRWDFDMMWTSLFFCRPHKYHQFLFSSASRAISYFTDVHEGENVLHTGVDILSMGFSFSLFAVKAFLAQAKEEFQEKWDKPSQVCICLHNLCE